MYELWTFQPKKTRQWQRYEKSPQYGHFLWLAAISVTLFWKIKINMCSRRVCVQNSWFLSFLYWPKGIRLTWFYSYKGDQRWNAEDNANSKLGIAHYCYTAPILFKLNFLVRTFSPSYLGYDVKNNQLKISYYKVNLKIAVFSPVNATFWAQMSWK